MTCEEVQQGLARRGVQVDDATVYRTLQWLKQNRSVSQMTRGTGADVYALIGTDRHHHLICVECGSVSEMGDELFAELREEIRRQYGFVSTLIITPSLVYVPAATPGSSQRATWQAPSFKSHS